MGIVLAHKSLRLLIIYRSICVLIEYSLITLEVEGSIFKNTSIIYYNSEV
jgi:hypothetical protein